MNGGYNGAYGRHGNLLRDKKRQDWTVGQLVNVGFLRGLTVIEKEPTPGDYLPDAYILRAATGALYRFVPHNGIERLS